MVTETDKPEIKKMVETKLEKIEPVVEETKQELEVVDYAMPDDTQKNMALAAEKMMEDLQAQMDEMRNEIEKLRIEKAQIVEEKKVYARELDAKEIELIEKQVSNTNAKQALREKIEAQKKFDNVMVRGKFLNQRAPGQAVKLTYMKYADDLAKWWTFEHNKIYTIPRGFADQINEYYAKIRFAPGEGPKTTQDGDMGEALDQTPIREQLYAFVPIGF